MHTIDEDEVELELVCLEGISRGLPRRSILRDIFNFLVLNYPYDYVDIAEVEDDVEAIASDYLREYWLLWRVNRLRRWVKEQIHRATNKVV